MAEIRYSLVYEPTWWQDVCRIEPHPLKWEEVFGAVEDILEREPEIITRRTRTGSLVLATRDYGFRHVTPMFVLFRIEEPAVSVPPGGRVSLRHVITEADVGQGLFFDYGGELAEECQELRAELLREAR